MKKLTLEEIGKIAGVSRATVSRVINNYPHIRPEVRERVEAIIAETGYQPNMVARSLASDRSNIIGLVIPSGANAVFTDPYFPRLTQGISKAANDLQLTLALFLFHSQEEERGTIETITGTGLIDGLIVTADHKEDSFVPRLLEREMPFVLIGRPEKVHILDFVDTDNVIGAITATEHLVRLGYQRIGTLSTNQNTAGDDRYLGYKNTLEKHGRQVDPHLVAYGDFSVESGYIAMKELLPAQPDAVFITSDTMALGAIRAIREAGLRIPEDIALIGFDDLPPAIQADPSLSTIRQPIQETGRIAVQKLIDKLDNVNYEPSSVILPNRLIVRASCGALHLGLDHQLEAEGVIVER